MFMFVVFLLGNFTLPLFRDAEIETPVKGMLAKCKEESEYMTMHSVSGVIKQNIYT